MMLTPRQLENIPKALVNLYAEAEADIIADMARRISKMDFIPSAQWQYEKLIEMGAVHDEIIKKLSKASGISRGKINRMMKDAGVKAVKADGAIYRRAGISPSPLDASPELQALLRTGIENTNGLFKNLTCTTANTATKQFENALDRAWLQITTGAFDRTSAVRIAVKDLTDKGLASVTYPSGHTDYFDVAVRRAILTGINQTALRMQERLADELGSDLVEVTAHAGARTGKGVANHAEWQGKIYSRSGTHPKYPSLREATGYGTGEGLGGWNCRHSFFPFFEGISEPTYTQAELKELNSPKYEYNGQKLTEYEATQMQRKIERNIRKWKREYIGMEAAGLSTDEAAAKLARWQGVQKDFIKQTGLKRQYDREEIGGFGRSDAVRRHGLLVR